MAKQESLLPLSISQRQALEEATAQYEHDLDADVEATMCLLDRGLEPETIRTFRLGVVGSPLPGHAHHRGRIAIPYLGLEREPRQVRFRCYADHDHDELKHGKYNTVKGDPSRLFNVNAIASAESVLHVAEGEFDAMILNQSGLPAVAVPGVENYKPHHRRMFAGFSRVWIWADPDEAGAGLVNTITRGLHQAKGVRLKAGDVTDTYLDGGKDALLNLIKE